MNTIGHYAMLRERAARIAAANPRHAERILGVRPKPRPKVVEAMVAPKPRLDLLFGWKPEVKAAICAVSICYDVPIDALLQEGRRCREVSHARFAIARILRMHFGWPIPPIGRALGFDHSSIYNMLTRAQDLRRTHPAWLAALERAQAMIARP